MKQIKYTAIISLFFLLMFSGCSTNKTSDQQEPINLTISAAVSLKDSLTEIQKIYEKENTSVTLTFNYGASGALQQQISQGAPVDIFFSAATDKLTMLVNEDLIDDGDHINLLQNTLVLITNKETPSPLTSFADISSLGTNALAIGTPESVPAGAYAKEALLALNLWEDLQDSFVFGKDVRQVLTYVETKNVEAGIVYGTDALTSDQVKVIATADPSTHSPIVYPIGILKNSKHYEEAKKFYEFLQKDEALAIFKEDGFIID